MLPPSLPPSLHQKNNDITAVGGVSDSATDSASASILRNLVASVVLPTLQILSTAPLEMIMAEQVWFHFIYLNCLVK